MAFTFNKAELDLNNYILTINKDKNFTVTNLGQITGAGTIKLTENNTVLLETGSSIGEDKKEVTILGDNNSNKIDLTNYLSLDNDKIVFDSNGKTLFLNLKGGQDIYLFDKILNKSTKQNIINSFNNNSLTVLFPNVKAESNTNGDTESFPTLTNIPYLFKIGSDKSPKLIDDISNVDKNDKINFYSILLEKIFDNNKINGNMKLKFGDNNTINDILKSVIEKTNGKESIVNIDSFIKYDSNIDVFSVISQKEKFNSTLSVETCEVKSKLADFSNIKTKNITVSKDLKEVSIENAKDINYIPNESSLNTSFDKCSNVTFIGSKDSSNPSNLTDLNLTGSNVNITGNVKLNGLISGDKESSLNINGTVILKQNETYTIIDQQTENEDNAEQTAIQQNENKDDAEQQPENNGNAESKGTDTQNDATQTGKDEVEEGQGDISETQANQDTAEKTKSQDDLEDKNQDSGSENKSAEKIELQVGPQETIQLMGEELTSEQQGTSSTQQNIAIQQGESFGISSESITTDQDQPKLQDNKTEIEN